MRRWSTDKRVARVVALSGGYTRADACQRLAANHGMIASFSRALAEGLKHSMSDAAVRRRAGPVDRRDLPGLDRQGLTRGAILTEPAPSGPGQRRQIQFREVGDALDLDVGRRQPGQRRGVERVVPLPREDGGDRVAPDAA